MSNVNLISVCLDFNKLQKTYVVKYLLCETFVSSLQNLANMWANFDNYMDFCINNSFLTRIPFHCISSVFTQQHCFHFRTWLYIKYASTNPHPYKIPWLEIQLFLIYSLPDLFTKLVVKTLVLDIFLDCTTSQTILNLAYHVW